MEIKSLLRKVDRGERINRKEGLELLREASLLELGMAARTVRFRINPQDRVTFVVDTNPNYTNICENECSFCAFFRKPSARDGYVLAIEDLVVNFRRAAASGVTTVLLQGGLNPTLPLDYYLELVRRTVAEVPEVHPHFFSAPEIIGMSHKSVLPVREVLEKLWDAGLRTLPGGGAEILSDRVRKKISPRKGKAADWLSVMREAHALGFKSTATMMYGHLENDEDIMTHLDAIRTTQDEHRGFTAFVPWSFKPDNTPLGKSLQDRATPLRYLRIIALARIYLDNFPHVQASWFSEGKRIGQIALHFGADDFGGTLQEENVHAAANYLNRASVEECISLIQGAGFDAAERNTLYEIRQTFPRKQKGKQLNIEAAAFYGKRPEGC